MASLLSCSVPPVLGRSKGIEDSVGESTMNLSDSTAEICRANSSLARATEFIQLVVVKLRKPQKL